MTQMKFLLSINPIKTLKFFKLSIYISLLHHFALINFFHKSLVKPKLKANIRKYWIHECGMDATRFPSLRCILKQCLKLAQDVVYGKQKVFAYF